MNPRTLSLPRSLVVGVATLSLTALTALAGCADPAPAGAPAASGSPGASGSEAASQEKIDTFESIAPDAAAVAKLPDRVKTSKKVVVVMNVSSAPTKFRASDNTSIVGLNPDVSRALGRVLGVTIDLQDVPFDGIIPGLQAKRFDLAVSSMAPSADRVKVLDMIRYAAWGTSLAVQSGNPQKLSVDAMCGKKIGVQQGSIQNTKRIPELSQKCTDAGKPAIEQIVLPDQTSALLQLSTSRVDGVLADTPVLAWAVKQRPGTIDLAGEINRSSVAIALPKDSDLTPAVQAGLQALMKTPDYQKIFDKWGMSDSIEKEAVLEDGTS